MFMTDVIIIYFFHLVPLLPIHLLNMQGQLTSVKCHVYFVVKSCIFIKFTLKQNLISCVEYPRRQDKAIGRLALENHTISMLFC